MIQYATLIQAAGAQAGVADTEEARRAEEAVIAAVAPPVAAPHGQLLHGRLSQGRERGSAAAPPPAAGRATAGT